MEIDKVGIDLGKSVFHLAGLGVTGETVVRKKFSRLQLLRFMANLRNSRANPKLWVQRYESPSLGLSGNVSCKRSERGLVRKFNRLPPK